MTSFRLLAVSAMLTIGAGPALSVNAAAALDEAQQQEIVAAHNKWRRGVGVPELRWAGDLAEMAQRWADHLRRSRGCALEHSRRSDLG